MALNLGSTYVIENCSSGKMLNIYNSGSVVNGTNVVQWSEDGSTEQKWVLQSGSSSGTYNLCSKFNTDLVLDAYAPMRPIPSGANADVWQDDDPQAQNLRITEIGGGRYKIALASNSTLALTSRGSANGSSSGKSSSSSGNVYWSAYSSSNTNQQWLMNEINTVDRHSPPAAGLYKIVNSNGVNLNVYAGRDQNGTSVVMWADDGSADQQFVLSNLNGRSKLFAGCSSNGSNRVIDAYRPSGPVQSGAKVQIWDNDDPVAQELVITPADNNYYKISLKSDNSLAITAAGSANNSAVNFKNYTGSASQKWRFEKVDPNANGSLDTHNPPAAGLYNIVSSNGSYLNVYAGRDANLTAMVMWAADGSVDQRFRLGAYAQGSKLYAACSSNGNNRVLDAYRPSGAVANGAKAQLYDSNDDISQTLIITPKGNGLYKIALNSNKTLALTAASASNNAAVNYRTYTGAANQLWRFDLITPIDISTHEPPTEGVYNLVNSNGAYLNVYAGNDANGTKVVVWSADGTNDQKFRLTNTSIGSRFYAMCSFSGAGRVLDAYRPGQYVLNGALAQIWNPTDDSAQLLCISKVGNKYKVALQSNTSLALAASGSANNSAVTYTTYTGAANQLWTLNRLSDWAGEPVPTEFSIERNHTNNCFPNRQGFTPQAWVCHIAEGTLNGTVSWFKNPDSQTSSNYVIGRDGRIVEMVPPEKAAWCNGTSEDSSNRVWWGNSTSDLVKRLKSNANYYTMSIEFEGYWNVTKGLISTAQLKAAAWLMKYVRRFYGINIPFNREHILGHYQVNPITKPHCPGELFPFDELIDELGEEDVDNYNPSTGAGEVSPYNLHFIKSKATGRYLTVNDGIDVDAVTPQFVVHPAKNDNTLFLADKKIAYDHSRNKHNPRQLFRVFSNGYIIPACSKNGLGFNLGIDGTAIKLLDLPRQSNSTQKNNLYYLPVSGTSNAVEYKIFSNYECAADKEKRLKADAATVLFTGDKSSGTVAASDEIWTLEALSANDNDGIAYFDEYEIDYDKYAIADESTENFGYVEVTGMPKVSYSGGKESFHPYSGMKNTDFSSIHNRIYDENLPEDGEHNPESKYRTIRDVVYGFYRKVFKNKQLVALEPTDSLSLYNLYGAFMSDPKISSFHMGVDMFTTEYTSSEDERLVKIHKGARIYSAHAGELIIKDNSYGTIAIYDDNENVTYLYLHMRDISNELHLKGEVINEEEHDGKVNVGTFLGIESNKSPQEIGKHLHFEVRKGKVTEVASELLANEAGTNTMTGNSPMAKANWNAYPMHDSVSPYKYML